MFNYDASCKRPGKVIWLQKDTSLPPMGEAFPPGFFDRNDPSPDLLFYQQPRFVTHIDDATIAALTRALALDHVGDGIRVNCVAPGTVETPFFDALFEAAEDPAALRRELAMRQAVNRLGTPEEIAGAMLYLACDESSFVTGTMVTVDGGMTAR